MTRGTGSRRSAIRAALVLALTLAAATAAAPTARDASAAAQKRCPKVSVAAVIGGEGTCLEAGQRCKRALDRQYQRYGFHCHTGRLTRSEPKPPEVFSRMVDVGGYRLAIHCRGKGSPTIVLESGGGASSAAWFVIEPTLAKTTRVCSYDRAGLGQSDPRPADPVPTAKIIVELHALLAAQASRRLMSLEAGPSAASSIGCTRSGIHPKCGAS